MLGKKVVGLISVVLLMTGCGTLSTMTTGSLVMLKGAAPVVATATAKIEILLAPPKTPYEVVALVQASAHVSDTLYMAEYEAAALEELKKQTAKAGGEGIIEVTREVLAGGSVLSTSTYGDLWPPGAAIPLDQVRLLERHRSQSETRVSNTSTLYLRGKAIRYIER